MPETQSPAEIPPPSPPRRLLRVESAHGLIWLCALVVITAWFAHAAARWWNYGFTTFDLAFYVQCLWRMVRGDLTAYSTLLDMPMLGNHADIIVVALAPIFAMVPHPLTPVAVQTLVCGLAGPLGYRTARAAGLESWPAFWLALTLLLTPAMSYAASFEFHPEALTATFLLLIYYGQVHERRWMYWAGAILTLSCKENMALLLAAWAVVHGTMALWETRAKFRWSSALIQNALLLGLSIAWFIGYERLLRPALNPSQVDYGSLYDHLGGSLGAVAMSIFTQPGAVIAAVWHSVTNGNLLWATLLPAAFLPLLRPRWIFIAGPILAQHLLSNRHSEWSVDHHYAAPLLALWFAAALETVLWLRQRATRPEASPLGRRFPHIAAPLCAALALLTLFLANFPQRVYLVHKHAHDPPRLPIAKRRELLREIPAAARVWAGPPYLSHLAERDRLYSLQLLSKGSLTLSTQPYTPPTDAEYFLIDSLDTSIFSLVAGFFHGPLVYPDGTEIPASDLLIHRSLREGTWVTVRSVNEWSLYRRLPEGESPPEAHFMPLPAEPGQGIRVSRGNVLHMAQPRTRQLQFRRPLEIGMLWEFPAERGVIPWMWLRIEPATPHSSPATSRALITRGLCLPHGYNNGRLWRDVWTADFDVWKLPPGRYKITLGLQDQAAVVAIARQPGQQSDAEFQKAMLLELPLGEIEISPP